MTRRERIYATLRGDPVDRPAVNFYEITGCESVDASDPFNIYADPSWRPLLQLAREKTDRLVRCFPKFVNAPTNPIHAASKVVTEYILNGSRLITRTVTVGSGRTLVERTRRDLDVDTVWTTEHLVKSAEDLAALLSLPEGELGGELDVTNVLALEAELGDTGAVLLDIGDPLCAVASLFEMGEYTVVALTEPELFHEALRRFARMVQHKVEAVAKALPGRLWRIVGPEYASPPYLPPALFDEYVVKYDTPLVSTIQKYGGYARIHSHGRLQAILDLIAATGCSGLDPIEPPPQGDVDLAYVRQRYGEQMVLFGNLEIADIENLPTVHFKERVKRALAEGTAGSGRGFVLQPSACPYGRVLSPLTLQNYEAILDVLEHF